MTTSPKLCRRDAITTMQEIVDDAWNDVDDVSLQWLGNLNPKDDDRYLAAQPHEVAALDIPVHGALIIIRGDANVRAFIEWAEAGGLLGRTSSLTPGQRRRDD